MQIVIILYYFLLLLFLPQQESSVGGLRFHGSEQPIANRTSYNVFDDKPVTFTDQFHIDFRLAFYPNTPIGYILRIKNKDSDRIFNLFFDGQGSSINFNYNEEGKSNLIAAELDTGGIPDMQWTNMRITFDLKGDSIVLSVADREFSVTDVGLPSSYRPVILFGKSDYIIDVPSFAIRDLTVGNASVSYSYALKENEGNNVYENDGKATGKVINPEWLINDAYHWKHEATFHSEPVAGANYNPEKKDFYYFNNDSLQIYNIISGETSVIPFDEDCPVDLVLGTNFLDLDDDKLYAYEVYYDYEYEGPTVASLDLENFRWTAESYTQLPTQLHHHGSFYNPETKNYTIFGGFGNMHYSKNFFSYSLDDNEWYTLEGFTGDVVSPRYFSSVGYLKNENSVYIFGGMGNESGEQTVGRKYYYDLYKVNFDTKHITKLWNIKWELDNIVPVRGMVVLNDSIFYTLGYPEHFTDSFLKLYEFSITDGRYRVLGDSIPIYSDKITTNANLYYDSGLNSLFAVVQEFEDDISSDLKIYSLDFPPITANELFSNSRNVNNREIALIVLLLLGVSIAGITIFLFKRRIGNRTKKNQRCLLYQLPPTDTFRLQNLIQYICLVILLSVTEMEKISPTCSVQNSNKFCVSFCSTALKMVYLPAI